MVEDEISGYIHHILQYYVYLGCNIEAIKMCGLAANEFYAMLFLLGGIGLHQVVDLRCFPYYSKTSFTPVLQINTG